MDREPVFSGDEEVISAHVLSARDRNIKKNLALHPLKHLPVKHSKCAFACFEGIREACFSTARL